MQKQSNYLFVMLMVLAANILCWGAMGGSPTGQSSDNKANAVTTQSVSQSDGQPNPVLHPRDVSTYHYNVFRQGQTKIERILTPSNVNSSLFGKVGFFTVDGKVDAQPLYANNMPGPHGTQNTLFVVTEHDSIYAFDADAGTQTWKVSALLPGETPSDDRGCGQITPEIGITNTPVFDRQRGPNGALYFVAMSKDSNGKYHQRLHALDMKTGVELFGGPTEIKAKYPGTGDGSQGGFVTFVPRQYAVRAGLLADSGNIYMGFTSHCDIRPYTGWLLAYDMSTLKQTAILNITPNGEGGTIWMAGSGLASDGHGAPVFPRCQRDVRHHAGRQRLSD